MKKKLGMKILEKFNALGQVISLRENGFTSINFDVNLLKIFFNEGEVFE